MSIGETGIMDKRARIHEVLHRTEMIHRGHGIMDERYWKHSFKMIGSNILGIMTSKVETKTWPEEFKSLLMRKNERYGDQPLTRWGPLGIMIRIDSKFARYCNIINQPSPIEELGETIEDTLQDILGYCVLGYCLVAPTS